MATASETYEFIIPLNANDAYQAFLQAANTQFISVKKQDPQQMRLTIKAQKSRLRSKDKFDIALTQTQEGTIVRALGYRGAAAFSTEGGFSVLLQELQRLIPGFDIDATDKPYVAYAVEVGSQTQVNSVSRSNGASIPGAIVGGALFGGAGAIVGSMARTTTTRTTSHEVFSTNALFEVHWSNGKVTKENVKRDSSKYLDFKSKELF